MNTNTLLHRQVHPSWVQQGRVTSQVFRPTPKDEKRLSVDDGDVISARDCWRHFTATLGHASVGVMSVTFGECGDLQLNVTPDPHPRPSHALIDFTPCSENEIRTKSKRLRAFADARGWQHKAEGTDES